MQQPTTTAEQNFEASREICFFIAAGIMNEIGWSVRDCKRRGQMPDAQFAPHPDSEAPGFATIVTLGQYRLTVAVVIHSPMSGQPDLVAMGWTLGFSVCGDEAYVARGTAQNLPDDDVAKQIRRIMNETVDPATN